MRSHAAAIAWEFRRRHRWGLIAVFGYLVVLVTLRFVILGPGATFEDEQSFAFAVLVPLTSTFMYFLAVFSFGLEGDLAGRQSIYPARMFTLPVASAALAGWPMFYGTVAMAILWLATRLLVVYGFGESQLNAMGWPSEVGVPLIWPALLAAAILAWTQALMWMPYALPGLRVIIAVLVMVMIDVVVIIAVQYKVSEPVMVAILAPNLPIAYLVACSAVARARRGDVPDWGKGFARVGRIRDSLSRQRQRFRSATSAQAWFEWRRHGRSLPAMVAILLPFELSLLFVFSETPAIVFETLLAAVLTPPFMAVFVAATVSDSSSKSTGSYGVTPFMATRPLTNASLVAVKLKVAMWSTLAACSLVILAIPLALKLSGSSALVMGRARHMVEIFGTSRAIAIVLLGFSAMLISTWKQLVQSLCIGLSGREWAVKGSAFVALSVLAIIVPVAQWILSNRRLTLALWNAIPWIAAVLVFVRLSAAAWIAVRLRDRQLVRDRTLILGAACWCVIVFALYGVFVWLLSTMIIPGYFFALVAILAIPLVRLSAAPLALDWNRHR